MKQYLNGLKFLWSIISRESMISPSITVSAPPWAAELRGELYFKNVQKLYFYAQKFRTSYKKLMRITVKDYLPDVQFNQVQIPAPRTHILFIVMPNGSQEVTELLEDRKRNHNVTIVDIVADIFDLVPHEVTPEEAVTASKTMSAPNAFEWWRDPERQHHIRRCLRAATAITTSWEHLVKPLQKFVGDTIPVYHLPDLHREQRGSLNAFATRMFAIMTDSFKLTIKDLQECDKRAKAPLN